MDYFVEVTPETCPCCDAPFRLDETSYSLESIVPECKIPGKSLSIKNGLAFVEQLKPKIDPVVFDHKDLAEFKWREQIFYVTDNNFIFIYYNKSTRSFEECSKEQFIELFKDLE